MDNGKINGDCEEYDYEHITSSGYGVNLLAGAVAGMAEHCIVYPLDLIKTRMQAQYDSKSPKNVSIMNAIKKSPTSLWRGVASLLLGTGPAHAVYFGTYEILKRNLLNSTELPPTVCYALSGSCATIASDSFLNPFDVVKQRMQMIGSPYKNVFECSYKVFKSEGIRAFYVSYPATLSISVPFHFIQFSVYETSNKYFNPKREYNPLIYIISGGIAGGMAAVVTTPLDVVKTALQTRTIGDGIVVHKEDLTIFKVTKKLYENYGFSFLIRGIKPRVLSIFPSTSICWLTYEFFKRYFATSS